MELRIVVLRVIIFIGLTLLVAHLGIGNGECTAHATIGSLVEFKVIQLFLFWHFCSPPVFLERHLVILIAQIRIDVTFDNKLSALGILLLNVQSLVGLHLHVDLSVMQPYLVIYRNARII